MICVLGGLALTTAVHAVANEENANDSAPEGSHPYGVIVERNIFDLKAPPPPPSTQPTNTPPPNIKLTGITTILGKKQALFMVQEPTTPGKPANKEESYILAEGQRQGLIEVVEINTKAANVKIKNDGVISVLAFEKVTLPQAPVSAPPNLAGSPNVHMPNMIPPPGGGYPGGGYNPQNRFNNGQPAGYNNGVNAGNPNVAPGLTSIPTRTLRSGSDQQQPQLSAEEQMIMVELQREQNKNNPNIPPLPPTPLTPGMNNSGGNGAHGFPAPPSP